MRNAFHSISLEFSARDVVVAMTTDTAPHRGSVCRVQQGKHDILMRVEDVEIGSPTKVTGKIVRRMCGL